MTLSIISLLKGHACWRDFPLIEKYATDERNFVKKAVNWALRQIGKKRPGTKRAAIVLAEKLANSKSAAARWNGKDALRELNA